MKGIGKIGMLTVFIVFPILAHGQDDPAAFKTPPSADVIARWVHGGDPREMAWAAVICTSREGHVLPARVCFPGGTMAAARS
jgi:hypothetical protein